MKSLVWLTESILQDCGMKCDADPTLDVRTIQRRVEHEGTSFLTICLPAFCSAFERALDSGRLSASDVPWFKWHNRGLPVFLRGFLLRVFNTNGQLLAEPCKETIACVRQILNLHKKILVECAETRTRRALQKYRECEDEVHSWIPQLEASEAFCRVSRVIWSSILSRAPYGDPRQDLHPNHGPGATAEKVLGNAKFRLRRWHTRLEEHFPITEFGIASVLNLEDCTSGLDVEFVEPKDEQPVRVVFVPKTQKTPRVIAIEPVCMQFVQQGLLQWLVPQIERARYTAGRVNFSDQSVNQKLALLSSADGRFATLDLSEASDRVSSDLVWDMLSVAPAFRDQVFACRSTRAQLPDGDIVTLSKFASMGSALCFPMEAVVFFCAIVSSRLRRLSLPITPRNIHRCSRDIYVYGDDIIVPVDEASAVCSDLELFGLKVNASKSFWTGKFRESCGKDAYAGYDVTPTYCRHLPPSDRRDASALIAWVSMANQFYQKGFWKTARKVQAWVEKILGPLPLVSAESQVLGWKTYSNAVQFSRWNSDLHRFEIKGWLPRTSRRKDPLSGDPALLKCFGLIGSSEPIDPNHLEHTVSRDAIALTRRWVPAY